MEEVKLECVCKYSKGMDQIGVVVQSLQRQQIALAALTFNLELERADI